MEEYKLEKSIWTQNDYEQMGWHDCPIYAMSFDDHVKFDLDYILKWNNPEVEGLPFTFWISPVTLTFENVSLFKVNFEVNFINGLEIAAISKRNLDDTIEWIIDTQEGVITIHATSYKQIIRRKPSFQFGQHISFEERGGISFSTIPDRDYEVSEEVLKKREEDFKDYEHLKSFKTSKIELEKLLAKRSLISTKQFLTEKRNLEEKITDLDIKLKETRFRVYSL